MYIHTYVRMYVLHDNNNHLILSGESLSCEATFQDAHKQTDNKNQLKSISLNQFVGSHSLVSGRGCRT